MTNFAVQSEDRTVATAHIWAQTSRQQACLREASTEGRLRLHLSYWRRRPARTWPAKGSATARLVKKTDNLRLQLQ